jgi:uncharacterized membrane protein YbhN (UPF0104 family)
MRYYQTRDCQNKLVRIKMLTSNYSLSVKQVIITTIKICISLLLIFYVITQIDTDRLLSLLVDANFYYIFSSLILASLMILIAAIRWKMVLIALGIKVPLIQAVRVYFVTIFLGNSLISTFGGDAVRVWLSVKHGLTFSDSFLASFFERIYGLIAMGFSIAIVLIFHMGEYIPTIELGAIIFILGIACGMLFLLIMGSIPGLGNIPIRLSRGISLISIKGRRVFLSKKHGVKILLTSLIVIFFTNSVMWLIALGIGVQLSFVHFMFFVPVIIIATFLPISIGGWGLRENTAIFFLGTVGVNAEEALLISILFGVIMILASLPGSMWMFDKFPWKSGILSESFEEEINYE